MVKVLVIANRLPVTLKLAGEEVTVTPSSGGLVSALKGVKSMDAVWIGWPGCYVPPALEERVRAECAASNLVPVFLSKDCVEDYYNGYCNSILWPLLHYVEDNSDKDEGRMFSAYEEANRLFAETTLRKYWQLKGCSPADSEPEGSEEILLWVHDYHLMILPQLLRKQLPISAKIGFFLHIPFPHVSMWRRCIHREVLLKGMLHANMIGFHIYAYKRNFMESCQQLLGVQLLSTHVDGRPLGGSKAIIKSLPIGIDADKFINSCSTAAQKMTAERYKAHYGGRKIILGVDRLDYMKGIYQKLRGYERFCEKYPDLAADTILCQLAVPSRGDVECYKRLKHQCHTLVGKINGRIFPSKDGRKGTVPPGQVRVEFMDKSVQFKELLDMYISADVCLISSVRDGMNLVACEYVASQPITISAMQGGGIPPGSAPGVLVISEFVGADRSLAYGSISMHPWCPDNIADALYDALTLTDESKCRKSEYAINNVVEFNANSWANQFCEYLSQRGQNELTMPKQLSLDNLRDAMKKATRLRCAINFDSVRTTLFAPGEKPANWEILYLTTEQDHADLLLATSEAQFSVLTPKRYIAEGSAVWKGVHYHRGMNESIESVAQTELCVEYSIPPITGRADTTRGGEDGESSASELSSSESLSHTDRLRQVYDLLEARCDALSHCITTTMMGNYIQCELGGPWIKGYIFELLEREDDMKVDDVSDNILWIHLIDELPELPLLNRFMNPPEPEQPDDGRTLVITIGVDSIFPPHYDNVVMIQQENKSVYSCQSCQTVSDCRHYVYHGEHLEDIMQFMREVIRQ